MYYQLEIKFFGRGTVEYGVSTEDKELCEKWSAYWKRQLKRSAKVGVIEHESLDTIKVNHERIDD